MTNVRWLWLHMRRVKGWLLLGILLMGCEAAANLAGIALQQRMIDEVILDGKADLFWSVLWQIAAAYLLYALLFTFAPHVVHLTFTRMRASMGRQLMLRMHVLPIAELAKERTANYVYHFTQDLDTSAHAGASDGPRFVQQLVSVLMIVGFMYVASPLILLGLLLLVGVYLVLGRRFAPARRAAAARVAKQRSALLVHLEEGVSATREVIAFHRQGWEAQAYKRKFGEYFAEVLYEGKLINRQLLISEPLKWSALLLVLAGGGALVMRGELSIGLFVVVFQFSSRLMEALDGLFQFVLNLSGKLAATERLRKVLGDQAHVIEVEHKDATGGTAGVNLQKSAQMDKLQTIRFEGVTFGYGEQSPVLKQLTLELNAGQKIAFVGESGGGKSTIASLLVRFHEPTGGQITCNGVALAELPRERWLERVTLVFQEPYLFADTIRMNLLMGRTDLTDERIDEVCRAMQIYDFISGLPDGYDTEIGERGVTLSGGQRQRLALARAVLRDSEVLILDEATSSLDLETERRVQENLDALRRGRITIIIAHRLSTVRNADRLFVMEHGLVAEAGRHEELLAQGGVYTRLVESQQENGQL